MKKVPTEQQGKLVDVWQTLFKTTVVEPCTSASNRQVWLACKTNQNFQFSWGAGRSNRALAFNHWCSCL